MLKVAQTIKHPYLPHDDCSVDSQDCSVDSTEFSDDSIERLDPYEVFHNYENQQFKKPQEDKYPFIIITESSMSSNFEVNDLYKTVCESFEF